MEGPPITTPILTGAERQTQWDSSDWGLLSLFFNESRCVVIQEILNSKNNEISSYFYLISFHPATSDTVLSQTLYSVPQRAQVYLVLQLLPSCNYYTSGCEWVRCHNQSGLGMWILQRVVEPQGQEEFRRGHCPLLSGARSRNRDAWYIFDIIKQFQQILICLKHSICSAYGL